MNYKQLIFFFSTAVLGTTLLLALFGSYTFAFKAFEFNLKIAPSVRGVTGIFIRPVGEIRAYTHTAPLEFDLELVNVDLELLKLMLEESKKQQELLAEIKIEGIKILKQFVFRLLVLAFLGGAIGVFALYHTRSLKEILQGGVIGFLLISALIAGSYYTYQTSAFTKPEYRGILKAAPWMISLAEEALAKFDLLGQEVQVMAGNLYNLFEKVGKLPISEVEGEIKVLHVSDIHNNPAAYKFIDQVVKNFKIDFIIDTGDISDFGTPIEAQLTKQIAKLNLPYLFIPGNHDSPAISKAMSKIPNVNTLQEELIEVKGLKVFGFSDPAAKSASIAPPSLDALEKMADYYLGLLAKTESKPDIVAVHNHRIAQKLAGQAQIILFGHDHQLNIKTINGSVLIDAGTTGAAGLRGLQSPKTIPFTAVIIHFQRQEEGGFKLVATDSLKILNLEGSFTLERKQFVPNQSYPENIVNNKEPAE